MHSLVDSFENIASSLVEGNSFEELTVTEAQISLQAQKVSSYIASCNIETQGPPEMIMP